MIIKDIKDIETLRKRFCKDRSISVPTFKDPYFIDTLSILGKLEDYNEFRMDIDEQFNNIEEYFQMYNNTKDKVINYIKNSKAFQMLNCDDMNKYAVNTNIRQGDVFKEPNIGNHFISIDIKKANFSSLVRYGLDNDYEFYNSFDWDEFIGQFSSLYHIKTSKYIRQVVFGNCNPKRQVAYQKFITNRILNKLDNLFGLRESNRIMSLCNDEIVVNAEGLSDEELLRIKQVVEEESENTIPLRFEYFLLGKVINGSTYIKLIKGLSNSKNHYELKCTNPIENIFVTAKLRDVKTNESCLMFDSQYGLAQLAEIPKIEIIWDKQGE